MAEHAVSYAVTHEEKLKCIRDILSYHTDDVLMDSADIYHLLGLDKSDVLAYREQLGLPEPKFRKNKHYFPFQATIIALGKFFEAKRKDDAGIAA